MHVVFVDWSVRTCVLPSYSLLHLQVYSKLLWHEYGELLATFVAIQILGLNMGLLMGIKA